MKRQRVLGGFLTFCLTVMCMLGIITQKVEVCQARERLVDIEGEYLGRDDGEEELTKELNIPTIVSLNPIMVDGTGMCGACRVTVGGQVKFACVDGPEFDGHLVNFDEAMKRQQIYKTAEGRAMLKVQEGDTHHGGCGQCGGEN